MGINYNKTKTKKHSYSSINTYDQCSFKYYLQYIKKNFFYTDNLAADFGSLCHKILEDIGLDLKAGRKPDYAKYAEDFQNINIPKQGPFDNDGGIYGLNVLKQKYPREFFEGNKNGVSYYDKGMSFIKEGMYSLEKYLNEHPGWSVWGCEQYFDITIEGYRFGGFIDRILYNEKTDEYIIEDIKTKDHPFKDDELITPLQFVIYVKALCDVTGVDESKIHCAYDLPICNIRQDAGSKGFVKRGVAKIVKMLRGIDAQEFEPHPTPLCAWCNFSKTNPIAPEEGKHLCPYHSLWTPDHRTFDVANIWEGMDRHQIIVERAKIEEVSIDGDFDFQIILDFKIGLCIIIVQKEKENKHGQ